MTDIMTKMNKVMENLKKIEVFFLVWKLSWGTI